MNLNFELNLTQQQKLVMTQQMQMSIKLLQMSNLELNDYIKKEIEENPLLEGKENDKITDYEKEASKVDYKELVKYLDFDNYTHGGSSYNNDEEEVSPFNFISGKESFTEYLLNQLGETRIDDDIKEICVYIIENLNSTGYLPDRLEDIASELNVNLKSVQNALDIVQSLEPCGVGARNLIECLKLQVYNKNVNDKNLIEIIDKHLVDIAENKYNAIASELNITPQKAQEYGDFIKKLEPKPSRGFYTGEDVKYVIPDAFIRKIDNKFYVIMNDNSVPKLSINNTYKNIINSGNNKEDTDYVKEKLNSALFLLKSIEQRKSTLYDVLNEILESQKKYFQGKSNYLEPMTLKDISEKLDVHESTISRAIREKYVYIDTKGLIKIRDLFTTGISKAGASDEKDLSTQKIKNDIKALIDGEDKHSPLSDQKICELLKEKGTNISRRTVAKYREEMDIKSSAKRKRY
ncbi:MULTISPECIES: RNA polymerase factor sigma-54 [Clostridium]|uniref:RNA polymerase factor sigma-54 n=1 Tax=Clostridium TaxID=1485 RepID=UPI0008241DE5|nr:MULTISPECIES: RNA polymerase factor sigma-54 [Clostridium]PJI07636.1 RNA polymerase factor sigma-54 [Clostridium sp. CT7]